MQSDLPTLGRVANRVRVVKTSATSVLTRAKCLPGVVLLLGGRGGRGGTVAAAAAHGGVATSLAAVDGREGAVVGGAVGQEGGALHLLDVVEAGDADEALCLLYTSPSPRD